MFGKPITLDGDFQVLAGNAPVRVVAVAGGHAGVFGVIAVGTGFADLLAGHVHMVVGQKKRAAEKCAGLIVQVQLHAPAGEPVQSRKQAYIALGPCLSAFLVQADHVGGQHAPLASDADVAFRSIGVRRLFIGDLVRGNFPWECCGLGVLAIGCVTVVGISGNE